MLEFLTVDAAPRNSDCFCCILLLPLVVKVGWQQQQGRAGGATIGTKCCQGRIGLCCRCLPRIAAATRTIENISA